MIVRPKLTPMDLKLLIVTHNDHKNGKIKIKIFILNFPPIFISLF